MPNLFSGVNLALQALFSHQQTIEVIEHNVANANTPGYRRQSTVLASVPSPTSMSRYQHAVGAGVTVERIQRFSLDFFDGRYRRELAEFKQWEMQSQILRQLEVNLAETTSDGLLPKIDTYFSAWQALSSDPTNISLRVDLRDRGASLAGAFRSRIQQIDALREEQDMAISQRVGEINSLAQHVASLNAEIARSLSLGTQPNDLLDRRDVMLDRLAEIAGAISYRQPSGEVLVSISGHALVVGQTAFELKTIQDEDNSRLLKILWADGQAFSPAAGELAGLLTARDEILLAQRAGLNTLAENIIQEVNALHRSGYGLDNATGRSFFSGTNAETIAVNSELDDLAKIAAAELEDQPGSGEIARQIAALQHRVVMSGNTATFHQYYNSQVTALGLAIQKASTNARDRGQVVSALNTQRESVSGVSLDEEAANLVKAQRAYQAAARLMNVVDEMLDRVINGLGYTGR